MIQPGKFDLEGAMKGYALNRMCYSLNSAENRAVYAADPAAYCDRFGLSEEERAAVLSMDKQALLDAGGNMYFFHKLYRVKRPETPEEGNG